MVAARLIHGRWPDIRRLGRVNYLPDLGIGALPLWVLTFGFDEEIGWRGFALPRLQRRHSALSATLILGASWALWHLPGFFYNQTWADAGLAAFPGLAFSIVIGAIVLPWLYNSTGGSIAMVAAWHGLFDFFSAARISAGTIATLMSIAVMLWAVAILLMTGPATLSRMPKVTGLPDRSRARKSATTSTAV